MTESEVKDIATKHVSEQELAPCTLLSVRRTPREQIDEPTTVGDEWVVQFQFDLSDDFVDSSSVALVIVDDATGEARIFESL